MNLSRLLPQGAFLRNSLIFVFGTFAANAVNYLFRLIVGRIVSVENYGQVESLVSIFNIFSVFGIVSTLFFADIAARHKAENSPQKSKRALNVFIKESIPFLTVMLIFFAIVSIPVKNYLKIDSIFPVFAVWISVLTTILLSAGNGILKGWQKFSRLVFSGIFGVLAKLVFGVAIIVAGFQVFGAAISFGIGSAVSLFWAYYFLRKDVFGKSQTIMVQAEKIHQKNIAKEFAGHIKKISTYFSAVMAIAIFANADMIAAKHNLGDYYASGFGALSLSSKIIFFTCSSITLVFFSHSAEQFYLSKRGTKIFRQAFFLIGLITLMMTIFYFLFPKFVLWMIYGGKYSFFSGYLVYFAVTSSLLSLNNLLVYHIISNSSGGPAGFLLFFSLVFFFVAVLFGNSIPSLLAIMVFFQVSMIIFQLFSIKLQNYGRT